MLSKRILVAVVAVGLLCACVADDASTEAEEEPQYAQVVFYKGIDLDGEYMVVGKNFTVKYSLYNVGTKNVQNVHFTDQWPEEYFDFASGVAENTWTDLAAGSNVSSTVILIPKSTGKFTTAPASFSYEVDSERKEGFSSSFGEVYVFSQEEHEKATATNVKEWVTFLVLSVVPVFAPLGIWYQHNKARSAAADAAKSK